MRFYCHLGKKYVSVSYCLECPFLDKDGHCDYQETLTDTQEASGDVSVMITEGGHRKFWCDLCPHGFIEGERQIILNNHNGNEGLSICEKCAKQIGDIVRK